MRRYTFLSIVVLFLAALCVQAADVSGQWVAQVPGRDGNTMETTFQFKVAGDQVTGTMANQFGEREISGGKITGDDLAFNVVIDMGGNQMTLVFKGKVAGDEIKFTRERRGGEGGPAASVEFVAKRKQ
jgi:hypothetical protein